MRVAFLIDGFNLYHSIKDAEKNNSLKLRWLDIHGLCKSYLPNIDKTATLESIHYFSAHAIHRVANDVNVINRHNIYIQSLTSKNINVHLGQFKQKLVYCNKCQTSSFKFEEKETDVALAVKIFELFFLNLADHIVLITGDTDIMPAIVTSKKLFQKPISIIFPYKRFNAAFNNIAAKKIKIKADTYARHQLPLKITLNDGREIHKPVEW